MLLRFVFEFGYIGYIPSDLIYVEAVAYEPFVFDVEAGITYGHREEETLGVEEQSAYRDIGRFVLLKILYEISGGKSRPYYVFYEDHMLSAYIERNIFDYLYYTASRSVIGIVAECDHICLYRKVDRPRQIRKEVDGALKDTYYYCFFASEVICDRRSELVDLLLYRILVVNYLLDFDSVHLCLLYEFVES